MERGPKKTQTLQTSIDFSSQFFSLLLSPVRCMNPPSIHTRTKEPENISIMRFNCQSEQVW